MAFDLSRHLEAGGEVPVKDSVLTAAERRVLKAMSMRASALIKYVIGSDAREVYESALMHLHTAWEAKVLKKAGLWDRRRDCIYSQVEWRDDDWPADERDSRYRGWAIAVAEARMRAIYQGTEAGGKFFAFGSLAVFGLGQLNLFGSRSSVASPAAVISQVDELVERTLNKPELQSEVDEPFRVDAALYQAAERSVSIVNRYRYSAATPSSARVADSDLSTNNRSDSISSILAGTNILFNLGILQEDGSLAARGRDRVAGDLAGKALLESGLDPTVEAVNARTADRARGLFQLKPETTFSLLGQHGHSLLQVDGLLGEEVADVLTIGMHNLGRRLASSPMEGVRESDRRMLARLARGYDFNNPGVIRNHSNLFHLAYGLLDERQKSVIRGAVVNTTQIDYGPVSGSRGAILSTVLAGLLADELNVPATLVDSYGIRVFNYISHQAGEGNANQIITTLAARDAFAEESPEWQAANVRLKRTIFRNVSINSNMSVYADTERLNADRAIRAEQNKQRRTRGQRPLPEIRMSEHYIRDWDNLVAHVNEMHGGEGENSLSAAVATLSRAVREGHVTLTHGPHNALAMLRSDELEFGPHRAVARDTSPAVVRAPGG